MERLLIITPFYCSCDLIELEDIWLIYAYFSGQTVVKDIALISDESAFDRADDLQLLSRSNHVPILYHSLYALVLFQAEATFTERY